MRRWSASTATDATPTESYRRGHSFRAPFPSAPHEAAVTVDSAADLGHPGRPLPNEPRARGGLLDQSHDRNGLSRGHLPAADNECPRARNFETNDHLVLERA